MPVLAKVCFAVIKVRFRASDKFYFQSIFFFDFPTECLLRVFIEFDMPADGQPHSHLLVFDEQNLTISDDIGIDGPIYELVDVRHAYQFHVHV